MAAQIAWFPQTKIQPPVLAQDCLERPCLLDALYTAVTTRRLTLVSAPAGSGKTTLLVSLLRAHPDLSAAWLRLDETDADPIRFLALLLATLQHCLPGFGADTQAALQTAQNPAQDQRRVLGREFEKSFRKGEKRAEASKLRYK